MNELLTTLFSPFQHMLMEVLLHAQYSDVNIKETDPTLCLQYSQINNTTFSFTSHLAAEALS